MKRCPKCKQKKNTSEFYQRRFKTDGLSSYCKKCQTEHSKNQKQKPGYYKAYYQKHKKEIYEADKARRRKIQNLITTAKNRACKDCGIQYPYYMMDFDHVREEKKFKLSDAISLRRSLNTIQTEINKCDAVCANCHRARTYNRGLA